MKTTEQPARPLELEAHPAMAGWAIVAKLNGNSYMVEGGLTTPDARLKHWNRNKEMIYAAITKATQP